MVEDQVRYEIDGAIATIVLNRPDKLNALTFAMADRFVELIDRAGADGAVKVIVVRGEGRAFCAGVDMEDHIDVQSPAGKSLEADRDDIAAAARRFECLWALRKPVIVKAHGYCVAWGLEIAMAADIVLGSHDCQFFFPSVRNGGGLPDSVGAIYHLGLQWAKRLLLTGEAIDGITAERIGLICQSYPAGELDAAVADLARRMSVLPAALLAESKAVINQSLELLGRGALQSFAQDANARARQAPEAAEFAEVLRRDGLAAAIEWRERRLHGD